MSQVINVINEAAVVRTFDDLRLKFRSLTLAEVQDTVKLYLTGVPQPHAIVQAGPVATRAAEISAAIVRTYNDEDGRESKTWRRILSVLATDAGIRADARFDEEAVGTVGFLTLTLPSTSQLVVRRSEAGDAFRIIGAGQNRSWTYTTIDKAAAKLLVLYQKDKEAVSKK